MILIIQITKVTISSNDSIGAGAGGESKATVTSTLSRIRTSSICMQMQQNKMI